MTAVRRQKEPPSYEMYAEPLRPIPDEVLADYNRKFKGRCRFVVESSRMKTTGCGSPRIRAAFILFDDSANNTNFRSCGEEPSREPSFPMGVCNSRRCGREGLP